jgi:glycosyltransferase involved in cell wall biosynthesis
MINVIFYIEAEWAFGVIHYELCKYLFSKGYNCTVMHWSKRYTLKEMVELDANTDIWVTNPQGYYSLVYAYQCIPPEKIMVVAHALIDINFILEKKIELDLYRIKSYCVVSRYLANYSVNIGIKRRPNITPVGINYAAFHSKPSYNLKTVGYGGCYYERNVAVGSENKEIIERRDNKRSYLAKECATMAGLDFVVASDYHNSFVTMTGFYSTVDCVIIPSMHEGAGLPALEAAAAGRLVIGTKVGHWDDKISPNGGIEAPMDEVDFISFTLKTLNYYKSDPIAHQEKCHQIQQHAKTYDWSNCISYWIEVFH